MLLRIVFGLNLLVIFPATGFALPRPLDDRARQSLFFRFENIWNEMETLSRNSKSDQLDLARQEREFTTFSVFEKIPTSDQISELTQELKADANQSGLKLEKVRVIERSAPPKSLPRKIGNHRDGFRLSEGSVAEEILLEIQVSKLPHTQEKTENLIRFWCTQWGSKIHRILVPVKSPAIETTVLANPSKAAPSKGVLYAKIYRFRRLRFPKLSAQDPWSLLPPRYRSHPNDLAREEPQLWSWVERIEKREKSDQNLKALYQQREKFLMQSAQMSFFLKMYETQRQTIQSFSQERKT